VASEGDIVSAIAGWQILNQDGGPSPQGVRSAAERAGGIAWVDTYLESESAFRQPVESAFLLPAEPTLLPNRAERRRRGGSR
jgi:hypothetical protein